ncbi:MAG: hypothetical protein ACFWUE_09610 [Xylanivirga thermophila]|jgi:hypothetical protein|uniref:hypothetical protein n=1 Tax=Xylanivirga thermophila TaxID=2496273 RepID=UPI0039F5A64F
MKIELTKEQYKRLVELAFAGSWMINSWRVGDDQLLEYDEIVRHLYSFYKDFEADDLIQYDEKDDLYLPTTKLEDKIFGFVDDYDDYSFWEELLSRIAQRDAENNHETVTWDNKMQYEEKYQKEFETHGIERLYVDWGNKK